MAGGGEGESIGDVSALPPLVTGVTSCVGNETSAVIAGIARITADVKPPRRVGGARGDDGGRRDRLDPTVRSVRDDGADGNDLFQPKDELVIGESVTIVVALATMPVMVAVMAFPAT